MWMNAPNLITLLRIVLIPLFVLVYYLPFTWAHILTMMLFVLAAVTDWLDGYLARKLDQTSPFGAFLDPVADKLMVIAALLLLVADVRVHAAVWDMRLFAVVVLIIIGREITVTALREWMAEAGKRASVAVSVVGKFKTGITMTAIPFLLFREPLFGLPVFSIGEILLYVAACFTLWSMIVYLRAAWPELKAPGKHS